MTDQTTPRRRRSSFVVSPVAQHEYRVLGPVDPVTRAKAEAAAREALEAARTERLAREAREEARRG